MAFVYSDDPFSKAVVAAARDQAKEAGLRRRARRDPTRRRPPISARSSTRSSRPAPTRFMGGGHYPDGATLARQLYDQKADLKWVSILVAPGRREIRRASARRRSASPPARNGSPRSPSSRSSARPATQFAKAYKAKFKVEAGLSRGLGLYRRRDPAARHRAGRLDRPGEGGGRAQQDGRRRPSSATSSSRPTRSIMGCRSRTRWCWRSGRRRTASWAARWSGPGRRRPPTSLYPMH